MVAIQNAITGELETAKVSVYVTRDVPKYKDAFTILFQGVNRAMVKKMTPASRGVLLFLCTISQYGNVIDHSAAEIAEELGYGTRMIELALKELTELKVIIKAPNPSDKRKQLIVLNPYQSWKGKPAARTKAIADLTAINQTALEFPIDVPFKISPNTAALLDVKEE